MTPHLATTCGCALVPFFDTDQPLWTFPASRRVRLAVLHDRRRRGVVLDDEPAGDPEYS